MNTPRSAPFAFSVTNGPLSIARLAICFIWLLLASTANGIASLQPPPRLPPLSDNPADRLRGAQLTEQPVWSDPLRLPWTNIGYFPNWGGNAFRLFLDPFADGEPILPDRPLTERLSKALERFTTVIDWTLLHNIHLIVGLRQTYTFANSKTNWPDDGRSLWKSASAQDELAQAWAHLAKHFKGKNGIMFDLMNEPHGITKDEINGGHALPKKVWNTLYPRLINAIRAEDPERWIIVEPIWGSADNFVDLTVSSASKLIYSFHFYAPHFFTHQGVVGCDCPPAQSVVYPGRTRDADWEPEMFWDKSVLEQRLLPAINFRKAHNVRVMCGEFGSNVNAPEDSRGRWTADLIELLEKYGFDWLYYKYESRRDGNVGWAFEATSFEPVVTSMFSLNLIEAKPVAIWTPIDSDGDGKSDIGVYRDGEWHILRSSDGGVTGIGWGGLPQDIPAPADYDGDGKTDIAVYRSGTWFILRSSDGALTTRGWGGLAQDIPVSADYDGDGKTDVAVYRDGTWFIIRSSDGGVTIRGWGGLPQDKPAPADYDGDGKTDIAVYRDGTWFILRSLNGGVITVGWGGLQQDVPLPADYDGDGKSDVAVYRDGNWYVLRSSDGGVIVIGWGGLAQDIPLN